MKYKTTIQIVTEAENKKEASEIAGEYLSGNLVSGVDMKCFTRPLSADTRNAVGVVAILLLVAVGSIVLLNIRPSRNIGRSTAGIDAIQPPLKTSLAAATYADFKKEWEAKRTKEALNYIKR